ncbi:uncharacterized protein G2W53_029752 [Senna tora]|uniref:Uncharacterized protein n=1 Tax=Senna tora TaxID=362788 RepID=A0A834T3X6_9FABA|nr:uncharacterized protein G2W53_029752 [Senna tora]
MDEEDLHKRQKMYRTDSQCEAEKLAISVEKETVLEDELENYYHKNLIIMCGSLQEIYRKKYGIRPVPKGKEEEEEEIVTHKMEKSDDSEACIDAAEKQPVSIEETADQVAAEEQTVLVKETDLHNVPIQMNYDQNVELPSNSGSNVQHEAHQNSPLQNVEPIPKQHSKDTKIQDCTT